jgi:tripartite-type tricarboxylate transporter receptor subunit TctC
MRPWHVRFGILVACAAALLIVAADGRAETYPSKPIRLVVPYPPGSGTDIVARLLGQKLTESWSQQVVVDNRPGAGAIIGAEAAAKAPADGYTLLMGDVGPLTINPALYAKLPYDPAKDFAPVSQVAFLPFVLVVHPSVQANSVSELVALAKAKSGELNYASVGNGSAVHLATELFKTEAGIDIVHVPYKGSAPALADLIGGRVSMMFVNVLSALPYVQSGQLRAVGIAMAQRSAALPQLPTIAEADMPGFVAGAWFGILVPAGTPPAIIGKLNAEIVRILRLPDVIDRLASQGAEPIGDTPEQFAGNIQRETAKWAKVVKDSGAQID